MSEWDRGRGSWFSKILNPGYESFTFRDALCLCVLESWGSCDMFVCLSSFSGSMFMCGLFVLRYPGSIMNFGQRERGVSLVLKRKKRL